MRIIQTWYPERPKTSTSRQEETSLQGPETRFRRGLTKPTKPLFDTADVVNKVRPPGDHRLPPTLSTGDSFFRPRPSGVVNCWIRSPEEVSHTCRIIMAPPRPPPTPHHSTSFRRKLCHLVPEEPDDLEN